uniref:UDP-N-acetylglucosamine transferase subunit ALG14 n=1 Tax=Attheya septentrionalis TaxID=420275 RepID=A0A7S2XQQ8_9STRA
MMQSLDRTILSPLTMVVADTDNTSERRLLHADPTFSTCTFVKIPRSREVGQSYLTSIFSTGLAFCKTVGVVARTRPDLVLINGPGTCLPIAYTTLFFRMAGIFQGKLIFVESFCRVQSLSLTGKLLYPVADRFIVHWEELLQKFPRSELVSTFIQHDQKKQ